MERTLIGLKGLTCSNCAAKIERDVLIPQFEHISINHILKGNILLFKDQATSKNIEIIKTYGIDYVLKNDIDFPIEEGFYSIENPTMIFLKFCIKTCHIFLPFRYVIYIEAFLLCEIKSYILVYYWQY